LARPQANVDEGINGGNIIGSRMTSSALDPPEDGEDHGVEAGVNDSDDVVSPDADIIF